MCMDIMKAGFSPYCPWSDFIFALLDTEGSITVQQYQESSMEWLKACDAMLLVEGWEESAGTKAEIFEAKKLNIPVFFLFADLLLWRSEFEGC